MRHMRFHEVTRSKRRAEREFASEHARGDDLGELLRVGAGGGGVGAADAEHFEHGGLGLEDGAAADGADFDGGHGDGDLEVAVQTGRDLLVTCSKYL